MGSGTYTVSWDGKDLNGSKVTGGVYFYRLEAGSFTAVKKMLMVK
jgi:flagellar hook assembly protein FlgD